MWTLFWDSVPRDRPLDWTEDVAAAGGGAVFKGPVNASAFFSDRCDGFFSMLLGY